jgi:hypothetical protein
MALFEDFIAAMKTPEEHREKRKTMRIVVQRPRL